MPPKKKIKVEEEEKPNHAFILYDLASKSKSTVKWTQQDFHTLIPSLSNFELLDAVNSLLKQGLLQPYTVGGTHVFEIVNKIQADKVSKLSHDEKIVYYAVASSLHEGIWIKHLKSKTLLHDTVIRNCLKVLIQNQYIKEVKSVKAPTRKLYMLQELQPSIEITGGPWFTDSELDSEFIHYLLMVCHKYIQKKSFPPDGIYPAGYSNYPNAAEVFEFLQQSKITEVPLTVSHVQDLLNILIYDDAIELRGDGSYKAVRREKRENL